MNIRFAALDDVRTFVEMGGNFITARAFAL